MSYIEINKRKIGPDFMPLIIAEIGINHGGSLDRAIKIADAAIDSGAELIKHQTHVIEDEMSNEAKQIIPGNANQSIFDIISKCALSEKDEYKLMSYIIQKGKIFISTPFSKLAVDRLEKFNVPAYKIGSGECNNYPLVEYIASKKKPIILSTGMNNYRSIDIAVEIFEKYNLKYALLHCTNIYPTPFNLVRLKCLPEMQNRYPNAIIGLSDHTTSNYVSYGAIALGASIIERHFTDSKQNIGPDIICSMDPQDLKEMISVANIIHQAIGGEKEPLAQEKTTIDFAFASVVAIKDIKKGEFFSESNIWVMRPGNGDFKAADFKFLIGKIAKRNIANSEQIKKTYVQD